MSSPLVRSLSSLDTPTVREVLAEIYGIAKNDKAIIDRAYSVAASFNAPPTVEQMSELAGEAALPVAPEVGRLLYMLVRLIRPQTVVEFGTSFGASLVYLAAALRDNGNGLVIGTEFNANKITVATANAKRAGLSNHVRLLDGDAITTLATVSAPVDLFLLDGWKELYFPALSAIEPALRPGSVVIADNLSMLPQGYLDYVRNPVNGYASIELPLGDGLELSLRQ
jgi:predicted O-methyltransferase YrrM